MNIQNIKNIQNAQYISLSEAAKLTKYSQDYISLLCRQGKMGAKKFGRNWVTTKDWVYDYIDRTKGKGEIVVPVKINKPLRREEPLLIFFRRIILATFIVGVFIISFVFSRNHILSSASQRFNESKKIIAYASSNTDSIFSLLNVFKPKKEAGIVSGVETSSTEKNNESLKNGLVVVPLEEDADSKKNQELIQKMNSSFSDDVDIKPSEDGISGIINPKNNPEDKYLYLMVPVPDVKLLKAE